jgi:hypothetical protein
VCWSVTKKVLARTEISGAGLIAFFKISSYEDERFYDWNEELLIGELNSEVDFALSQVARRYPYSI